jgi:hypothetical protein
VEEMRERGLDEFCSHRSITSVTPETSISVLRASGRSFEERIRFGRRHHSAPANPRLSRRRPIAPTPACMPGRMRTENISVVCFGLLLGIVMRAVMTSPARSTKSSAESSQAQERGRAAGRLRGPLRRFQIRLPLVDTPQLFKLRSFSIVFWISPY